MICHNSSTGRLAPVTAGRERVAIGVEVTWVHLIFLMGAAQEATSVVAAAAAVDPEAKEVPTRASAAGDVAPSRVNVQTSAHVPVAAGSLTVRLLQVG